MTEQIVVITVSFFQGKPKAGASKEWYVNSLLRTLQPDRRVIVKFLFYSLIAFSCFIVSLSLVSFCCCLGVGYNLLSVFFLLFLSFVFMNLEVAHTSLLSQ